MSVFSFIQAQWPAPATIHAGTTTRGGGVSQTPFDGFNVGSHVGDNPRQVAHNRSTLRVKLALPAEPLWLQQVHGIELVNAPTPGVPRADGSYCSRIGTVCAILSADCLPVLLCDRAGTRIAALHCGWRGLAGGIIEHAVQKLAPAAELMAWLGPAIGAAAFEVGADVQTAFCGRLADPEQVFQAGRSGHWQMDLYSAARQILHRAGVKSVHGGGFCTYTDNTRFYSYRREGVTGRMASLIWITAGAT